MLGGRISLLLTMGALLQQAPQDEVVIRTTTSLVEVRVVVQDKGGTPIANLKQSDFEILDDGVPQPIRLFAAYRDARTATAVGTNPDRDATAAGTSPTPSEYAFIVLDWLNSSYPMRLRVQENLLKLLDEFEPRQRVGIYVLSRLNSGLLSDFTYDRKLLTFLVKGMSLDPEDMIGPLGGGAPDRPDGGGRGAASSGPREAHLSDAAHQLVDTTLAFEMLSKHLLHVPGRKTLIWMSGGIPRMIASSYFSAYLEPAIHKLNVSDTAVYTTGGAPSLIEFSERTGGLNCNEGMKQCMQQALQDTDVSYTVGFHLPEAAKPGLHAIRVRVDVPHAKLRYRESYDPYPAIH